MNLTRRLFLGRTGSITIAAAAPVGVAVAVADPLPASAALATALEASRLAENPELLALGAELASARKRYADAQAALPAVREAALRLAPSIPDGLPVPFGISVFGQIEWYSLAEPADILGNPIELPRFVSPRSGKTLPVRVPKTEDILSDRQCGRRWNHGHRPAWQKGEHRRLYDLAVKFERDTADAREGSGLNEAEGELWRSRYALTKLAMRARGIEAKTIVGLLIKAQAANAAGSIVDEHDPNGSRVNAGGIGANLAEDFERIMTGATA